MSSLAGAGGGEGFGYSSRSLEELRALSGSVDNGRIGEMQSHFASVAEQVDDAVSQLVALRSDLPNWWKGTAANTAMASFDRVISHAQSTHEIAAGAAKSLKLCSAVVAEQQSAMAAVPEVDEPPGMPLVAQPFQSGTAESAIIEQSQAARYEAARAKAVGVVDGLAAQFVETRAQLAGLRHIDEGRFQPIVRSDPSAPNPSMRAQESVLFRPQGIQPSGALENVASAATPSSAFEDQALRVSGYTTAEAPSSMIALPFTLGRPQPVVATVTDHEVQSIPMTGESPKPGSQLGPMDGSFPIEENPLPAEVENIRLPDGHEELQRFTRIQSPSNRDVKGNREPLLPIRTLGENHPSNQASKESAEQTKTAGDSPQAMQASDYEPDIGPNSAMLEPPFSTIGANRSRLSERGRRPDYLKAAKESWIVDQDAVPYGGILTPDWAER